MQREQNIPERFTWALKAIDVGSTENILEIGCGAGILAALIGQKLGTGKITALDRSKSLSEKAAQRLESFIHVGRAEVITKDFNDFIPTTTFDKIVAFNVGFFWKNSAKEFEVLKNSMHKRSVLFVFYDGPGKVKTTIVDRITENLLTYRFRRPKVIFMNKDMSVCCIKSEV
jgi:cyclopropane fatty-acyl-phospholipid synthase-like methyltransferase